MDFEKLMEIAMKDAEVARIKDRMKVFLAQEDILNDLPQALKDTASEMTTMIYQTLRLFFTQGVEYGYQEAKNRVMGVFGPEMNQSQQLSEEELKKFDIPEDAVGEEISLDDDESESTSDESDTNTVPVDDSNDDDDDQVIPESDKIETSEPPIDAVAVNDDEEDDYHWSGEETVEEPKKDKPNQEHIPKKEIEKKEEDQNITANPDDIEYKEVSKDDMKKIIESSSNKNVTDLSSEKRKLTDEERANDLFSASKIKQHEMLENKEFVYQEEPEEKVHAEPVTNPTFWNSFPS